jgi:hypothetical protein
MEYQKKYFWTIIGLLLGIYLIWIPYQELGISVPYTNFWYDADKYYNMALEGKFFTLERPFSTRFFGPLIVGSIHVYLSSLLTLDWVFLLVTFGSLLGTAVLLFDYLDLLEFERVYQILGVFLFVSSSMIQHYMVNYVLIDPIFMFFYMSCLWLIKKGQYPRSFFLCFTLGVFVKEYLLIVPFFVYYWKREWLKYCIPGILLLVLLWVGMSEDPFLIESTFTGKGAVRNSNWGVLFRPDIWFNGLLQAFPLTFPFILLNLILKNPITNTSAYPELWKIWGISLLKILYRGEILRYLFVVGFPLAIPLGLSFLREINQLKKGDYYSENKIQFDS